MNDRKFFAASHPGQYAEHRRATDLPTRPRSKAEGLEAYSNWVNRDGKAAATAPPANRHSAITRRLYNWTSYKTWADNVRSSWGDGKDDDK